MNRVIRFSAAINKHSSIHQYFMNYVKETFNSEIWKFIQAINLFENSDTPYKDAGDIIDTYISSDSKFEINISGIQKSAIYEIYDNSNGLCDNNMFTELKKTIIAEFKTECFSKFTSSEPATKYITKKIFASKRKSNKQLFIDVLEKNKSSRLNILKRLTDEYSGIQIRTKWIGLVKYPMCFEGRNYVSWMVNNTSIGTVYEAMEIGDIMIQMNWMVPLYKNNPVCNNKTLYRFVVFVIGDKIIPTKPTKKKFKINDMFKKNQDNGQFSNSNQIQRSYSISSFMDLLKTPKNKPKVPISLDRNKRCGVKLSNDKSIIEKSEVIEIKIN